jgi:hypothetical protein
MSKAYREFDGLPLRTPVLSMLHAMSEWPIMDDCPTEGAHD